MLLEGEPEQGETLVGHRVEKALDDTSSEAHLHCKDILDTYVAK